METMTAILSPYLWIMLLLIGLILPYERGGERVRVIIGWALLNLFVLFFGLRGDTGNDYAAYQHFYYHVLEPGALHYEPAFTALAMLLRALHLPFQCFVFLCSCIINGLLFCFIWRRQLNMPLVLCVFWGMSGIAGELDFTRSTIATMLFVNALAFLEQRQAGRYFALVGLACLFHYAALLYLPLYFVLHRRMERHHYLTAVLVLMVLGLLRLRFLDFPIELMGTGGEDSLVAHYQQYVTRFGGIQLAFTIAAAERLLTAALVVMCYERLSATAQGRMAANGFLAFYLCYTLLAGYAVMATRLAHLFVWSYWLLWPMLLAAVGNVWLKRTLAGGMTVYLTARVWSVSVMGKLAYVSCFH